MDRGLVYCPRRSSNFSNIYHRIDLVAIVLLNKPKYGVTKMETIKLIDSEVNVCLISESGNRAAVLLAANKHTGNMSTITVVSDVPYDTPEGKAELGFALVANAINADWHLTPADRELMAKIGLEYCREGRYAGLLVDGIASVSNDNGTADVELHYNGDRIVGITIKAEPAVGPAFEQHYDASAGPISFTQVVSENESMTAYVKELSN